MSIFFDARVAKTNPNQQQMMQGKQLDDSPVTEVKMITIFGLVNKVKGFVKGLISKTECKLVTHI